MINWRLKKLHIFIICANILSCIIISFFLYFIPKCELLLKSCDELPIQTNYIFSLHKYLIMLLIIPLTVTGLIPTYNFKCAINYIKTLTILFLLLLIPVTLYTLYWLYIPVFHCGKIM